MNFFKPIQCVFIGILWVGFGGCQNQNNSSQEVITDDMVLELRANYHHDKEKLKLLDKDSKTFQALQSYINSEWANFKEADSINVYPSFVILGENLRILFAVGQIYLEYQAEDGEIKRLSKKMEDGEWPASLDLSLTEDWVYDFGNLYGYGQFETAKYMTCDLTYNEVKYQYKVGHWKFWNLNRKLLGEGKFKSDSSVVKDRGGCDFTIKTAKIDLGQWTFYDEAGQRVHPKIELLHKIENASIMDCH